MSAREKMNERRQGGIWDGEVMQVPPSAVLPGGADDDRAPPPPPRLTASYNKVDGAGRVVV